VRPVELAENGGPDVRRGHGEAVVVAGPSGARQVERLHLDVVGVVRHGVVRCVVGAVEI
jgi:hypothetical protein